MTAPNREILANYYATTLDGGIDASVTSVDVADGSGFPSTGNFRCLIGEELVLVTARSGNTLTVTRGVESTLSASHGNGDAIETIFTAGALERWGRDNVPLWGYGAPYGRIVGDDGVTVAVASDFTWVNQGTSAVTDQSGTIILRTALTTGINNRLLTRPSGASPYTYIAAFAVCLPKASASNGCFVTMGFRESSTGKFEQIEVGSNLARTPQVTVSRWTNATTFSANVRTIDMMGFIGQALWLKIEEDGSNLKTYVGNDGVNWVQLSSTSKTAFMAGGPDQVFWGGRNDQNNTNAGLIRLLHWSREV